MAERGNTTHGPGLDDQIEQETAGMTSGTQPAHVEEFRETEAFADDTDSEQVQEAARLDPPEGVEDPAGDEETK